MIFSLDRVKAIWHTAYQMVKRKGEKMGGSGNFIIDMHEKEQRRQERYDREIGDDEDAEYCSDCDSYNCRCDDDYERSRDV